MKGTFEPHDVPHWTLSTLHNLLDETNPPYVSVSDFLLLDTEHISKNGADSG